MEKEKIQPDYDLLREQFKLVAKDAGACQGFMQSLEKIKDKATFNTFFRNKIEMIADHFGMEGADTDDLEEQISDLEDEVSSLQSELDELKEKHGTITTYWDELKVRHFNENKDKYNEWDLQTLLENGKKYLQLAN